MAPPFDCDKGPKARRQEGTRRHEGTQLERNSNASIGFLVESHCRSMWLGTVLYMNHFIAGKSPCGVFLQRAKGAVGSQGVVGVAMFVVVIVLLLPLLLQLHQGEAKVVNALYSKSTVVRELESVEAAKKYVRSGDPSIVAFYAPWCGHCQHFVEPYEKFARQNNKLKIQFGAVNCVAFRGLCEEAKIRGYPTLLAFNFRKGLESSLVAHTTQFNVNIVCRF